MTAAAGRYRLGIDIGGTFTDLQVLDEATGRVVTLKTPSTAEPEEAVAAGLALLDARHGIKAADIGFFSHGTTIGVNTLLERKGASVGVVTTRGFRDVLELRRLRLAATNDLFVPKPVSLVPRRHVVEVDERVLADGTVRRPIERDAVLAAARALVDLGIQAIAVCFLHAYRNPEHERLARTWIAEAHPGLYVCASSDIWPQQREYERFLVAVINAYIGGRLRAYFGRLGARTTALGLGCRIFSTKSNGGVMSVAAAAERPVETLLSGPASGVIGAAHVGRQMGEPNLVTLDMGGTSVDVSVVRGEVHYGTENTVGDFPVILPAVDVSAIGAGGGSIAWLDSEGVLKVGPTSAGARPGPACYGRGGTEATVTDAYLTVGILDPSAFLGGAMTLDADAGVRAVEAIGRRLGFDRWRAAEAILRVASANIYAALMPQLARRGIEASEFSLLAYGSAGPTHTFLMARELPFRRLIVPPAPGTLCALGCVVADLRADFVRSLWRDAREVTDAELVAQFGALETEARSWLAAENVELEGAFLLRSADVCYTGQSFEVNVPIPEGPVMVGGLADLFHERYERVYGYADRSSPVRILEARAQIVGVTRKAAPNWPAPKVDGAVEPMGARRVYADEGFVEASVYRRLDMPTATAVTGPAIIEQYDTTVFVPRGIRVTIDPWANLVGARA
ncbi:MAG: hydantoinase/oxoprolinase family protein [Alphaproteobacteria bacterium]|nr:hydantoinase/oxoprolinase family protein [Alphaproteobacteria bacterium]